MGHSLEERQPTMTWKFAALMPVSFGEKMSPHFSDGWMQQTGAHEFLRSQRHRLPRRTKPILGQVYATAARFPERFLSARRTIVNRERVVMRVPKRRARAFPRTEAVAKT